MLALDPAAEISAIGEQTPDQGEENHQRSSRKESSPIGNGDAPRLSSSQGSATCWAKVPRFDSRLADQNVPKRRVQRRLNDARNSFLAFFARDIGRTLLRGGLRE